MQFFKTTYTLQSADDLNLSDILSNQSILNQYDVINNQLISKHTGNRKPRLLISIEIAQKENSYFLKIEIRLMPLIRRLLILSILISILITLMLIIHFTFFQIRIIDFLEQEIRMMVYALPFLALITLGIYFLAFRQETVEFQRLFNSVLKKTNYSPKEIKNSRLS